MGGAMAKKQPVIHMGEGKATLCRKPIDENTKLATADKATCKRCFNSVLYKGLSLIKGDRRRGEKR